MEDHDEKAPRVVSPAMVQAIIEATKFCTADSVTIVNEDGTFIKEIDWEAPRAVPPCECRAYVVVHKVDNVYKCCVCKKPI